jgi:hypothetical protein
MQRFVMKSLSAHIALPCFVSVLEVWCGITAGEWIASSSGPMTAFVDRLDEQHSQWQMASDCFISTISISNMISMQATSPRIIVLVLMLGLVASVHESDLNEPNLASAHIRDTRNGPYKGTICPSEHAPGKLSQLQLFPLFPHANDLLALAEIQILSPRHYQWFEEGQDVRNHPNLIGEILSCLPIITQNVFAGSH